MFTFYGTTPYPHLSLPKGNATVHRYQNGELHVTLITDVTRETCVVVGTIAPPDANLLQMLALTHTLKLHGASSVTAVLPYLAYARHDRIMPAESMLTELVGKLFFAAGCTRVVCIDAHSQLDATLFPLPLSSLSPATLFAEVMHRDGITAHTIVSPDAGGVQRAKDFARAYMGRDEIVCFSKKREGDTLRVERREGTLSHEVIIVDDMLDTGRTLVACSQELKAHGVTSIIIVISHGLFTDDAWHVLWQLNVHRIYVLDTVPLKPSLANDPRITVVPAASLLETYIHAEK